MYVYVESMYLYVYMSADISYIYIDKQIPAYKHSIS